MHTEERVLDILVQVDQGDLHPDQAYYQVLAIIDDACAKARKEEKGVNSTDSVQE